jgi:putative transcriptional regulator
MSESEDEAGVLASKRSATAYRILVAVAERQPAVSQQEIADAVGVTSQAVSDYLADLDDEGYVRREGRGRYEVTKEGVDWLISRTESLREFVERVSTEVVGGVEMECAVATAAIAEGDRVALSMRDGVLHATPKEGGTATATAVTDAAAGTDVAVTDFEGILDYEPGTVTIVAVPRVDDGGSRDVASEAVGAAVEDHDLLAVAGAEALVAVRAADHDPDLRFGTPGAVREAAATGLDVAVFAVSTAVSAHTSELHEADLRYEVHDAADFADE